MKILKFLFTAIFTISSASNQETIEVKDITYNLNLKDKNLRDMIYEIGKKKGINIYVPDGVQIEDKVTLNYKIVTIDKAWNYLQMILNSLGYTISPDGEGYKITKTSNISSEPLPIYSNVPSEQLPDSESYVRYIYLFKNINISDPSSPANRNITQIVQDMMPGNVPQNYILDQNSNSLILTGKAISIKSIIKLIEELDISGFRESITVVPLYYTDASRISGILNNLVPQDKNPMASIYNAQGPTGEQQKMGYYFSENTKVTFIDRTNSVVILGNKEAVSRIKDFITKYLDKPLDKGKSVIHVKKLQYLDASQLATDLQAVVTSGGSVNTQSTSQKQLNDTLSNVVIRAEKEQQAQPNPNAPSDAPQLQSPIIGGNNLIVAAEEQDWIILEKVIDELDQPELQVALETLIVDLTLTENRALGSQARNFSTLQPQEVRWQSAQIIKPWLNFVPPGTGTEINTVRGIAADMLEMTNPANLGISGDSVPNPVNIPLLCEAGSTMISIKDGYGISDVLQVLNTYGNATVLSRPFGITKNHQTSTVAIAQTRLTQGSVSQQTTGGPVILPQEPITASLTVSMTPRISRSENINLEISVSADDFVTTDLTNNTRNIRQISTNANLGNKEILVLGGLTKDSYTTIKRSLPILGDIPIIGYLFKKNQTITAKSTLMVFIQPTIIRPRISGGIDPYTQSKIDYAKDHELMFESQMEGAIFDNLKDPITRIFFHPNAKEVNAQIDEYAKGGAFHKPLNQRVDCFAPEANKEICLKNLVQDCKNPLKK